MVGVPKSTGCKTCRTRKIKCDEVKPSCLKCLAGGFQCDGYASRLKFQDEGSSLKRKYSSKAKSAGPHRQATKPVSSHASPQYSKRLLIPKFPLSQSDKLASRFYQLLGSDMQVAAGTNLASFGKFMTEVPLHIGHSKVLDLSMESLYAAHCALFSTNESPLRSSQILYGKALRSLQESLKNKKEARSPETLCATVLLSIYEAIIKTQDNASIQHAGGAASLIKVKGPSDFQDTFAREILSALRRKTIIDATTAGKKCFLDEPEWKKLFDNENSSDHLGFGTFFSLSSEVPEILGSFKTLKNIPTEFELAVKNLRNRATLLRSRLQAWREHRRPNSAFQVVEEHLQNPLLPRLLLYQSSGAVGLHCTYLTMMILINYVLLGLPSSRFYSVDAVILQEESEDFAIQICHLYDYCARFAPFGNLYMKFALQATLLAITIESTKAWMISKLQEMSASLRISPMSIVCVGNLDPFWYLKY